MVYTYNLPNTTGGFDTTIIGIAQIVPPFIPLFLLSVYAIVTFGGSIAQKSRTGFADVPLWSTIGGLATLLVTLPMTLTIGLIEPVYLIIVVLVTIMSGVWLFLNQNRNEV